MGGKSAVVLNAPPACKDLIMEYIYYDMIMYAKALWLTGLLWFNTGGNVITGEDTAAVNAALIERSYVPKVVGTNEVAWTTNNVLWATNNLYTVEVNPNVGNFANIVSDLRKLCVTAVYDNEYRPPSFPYETYWLFDDNKSLPPDGFVLAEADIGWQSTNKTYSLKMPENIKGNLITIYDNFIPEKEEDRTVFNEHELTNRVVIAERYYPQAKTNLLETTLWKDKECWWNYIGLGTNNFHFPFEIKQGPASEIFSFNKLGKRFIPPRAVTNFNIAESVSMVVSNSSTTNLGSNASVILVTGERSGGANSFSVYDNDEPKYLNIGNKAITVENSKEFDIDISLKEWHWGMSTVRVSAVSIPLGFAVPMMSFTKNYVDFTTNDYSQVKKITGKAPYSIYKGKTSGSLVRLNFKKYNEFIAVTTTGNPESSNPWKGLKFTPSMALIKDGETKDIKIDIIEPVTNSVFITPSVYTTNELHQIRGLLTNLNKTVSFLKPKDLKFEEGVKYLYSLSTNINDDVNWKAYTEDEVLENINATLEVEPETNIITYSGSMISNTPFWSGGRLSNINIGGFLQGLWAQHDPLGGTDYDAYYDLQSCTLSVNSNIENTRLKDCYFDYPSEMAFTNDYIKNIAIYARIKCSYAKRIIPDDGEGFTSVYDQSQPKFYESVLKGVVPDVLRLPPLVLPPNKKDNFYSLDNKMMLYYEENKLVLLATAETPSEFPLFDLGISKIADFEETELQKTSTEYEYKEGGTFEQRYSFTKEHRNEIQILEFILVTEWNWKHLNKYNIPFEPQLNTPEWTEEE